MFLKYSHFFTLVFSALVATSFSAMAQVSAASKWPLPADSLAVETKHKLADGKTSLDYVARAGFMVLRNVQGKPQGTVFYTAYTLNGQDKGKRPVTFCFNGGPGSSSVWLHMGHIGPKRVVMNADGTPTAPPFGYADNPQTWLRFTDLVFIDPVMTGYSQPVPGVEKSEFTGYSKDLQSVGEFIRLYCSANQRWASPKFLAGESYGTTRAAGLAALLQDNYGLYVNGVCLISAVLNFQTLSFDAGNDLAYACFLPTMAATAWYHKQAGQGSTAFGLH